VTERARHELLALRDSASMRSSPFGSRLGTTPPRVIERSSCYPVTDSSVS
jgi:hypothetical protein